LILSITDPQRSRPAHGFTPRVPKMDAYSALIVRFPVEGNV
jgi:hypothetical protein